MIETAAIIIPAVLLAFIGIVAGSLICCCCCCALPLWNLLTGCWQKSSSTSHKYQQMVDLSAHSSSHQAAASAYYQTQTSDHFIGEQEHIPIVEAYIVPPLEAASHHKPSHPSSSSSAGASVESASSGARFKDVWAGILFLINLTIIVVLAFQSYHEFQQHIQQDHSSSQNDTEAQTLSQYLTLFSTFLLIMVPTATLIGSLSLYVLVQNAGKLIDWVNWFNIITCGFMTLMCLITLNIIGTLIFAFCTIANYWYYWSIQDRIPFASAVISTACTAVKKNFTGLMITSFSGLFFQLLWALLWIVALFGVTYEPSSTSNKDDDESGGRALVYFLMLVSFYWGAQVIQYVVSVTAGGTVASWWFQPTHPAPVRGAVFRALTTSFGSICFGSLIVAFLQALRALLRNIRQQADRRRGRDRNFALVCLICIADSLLKCIEDLVVYFNRFAYSYIAAYGYDLIGAGREVMALFTKRGWNAIINDNLIANAFMIQIIALAVVNGLLGSMIMFGLAASLNMASVSSITFAGGIFGILIGIVVASLMVSCLDSAVCMVFVCFAEDPSALQSNHPETYYELARSWELFNPGTLTWTTANTMESGNNNSNLVQAHVIDHHHNTHSVQTHYGLAANQNIYAQPTAKNVTPASSPYNPGYIPTTGSSTNNPPPYNPNYREYH